MDVANLSRPLSRCSLCRSREVASAAAGQVFPLVASVLRQLGLLLAVRLSGGGGGGVWASSFVLLPSRDHLVVEGVSRWCVVLPSPLLKEEVVWRPLLEPVACRSLLHLSACLIDIFLNPPVCLQQLPQVAMALGLLLRGTLRSSLATDERLRRGLTLPLRRLLPLGLLAFLESAPSTSRLLPGDARRLYDLFVLLSLLARELRQELANRILICRVGGDRRPCPLLSSLPPGALSPLLSLRGALSRELGLPLAQLLEEAIAVSIRVPLLFDVCVGDVVRSALLGVAEGFVSLINLRSRQALAIWILACWLLIICFGNGLGRCTPLIQASCWRLPRRRPPSHLDCHDHLGRLQY